ncbi:Vitamin B12 transporter BtuB [Pseudoalteromonas holothuriae]|uniref:Vitamin B12 transporter BtuB n=1 Tax=Pseudoalteromonas holothuriae TaxID=2963714 RepID=A0A9W4R0X5_9GAMM|nr:MULTISPECIES: TonB-dependent receptor [unclassified Pseudoalteromonas]CAH9062388.1 Vitamin B12 transporter BtuB [Pseudoalteromonas sp. CIP111854]CAH9066908.1 Vitamin B12 transporter BtuB [Pseudoalteromonas sp. CIP111951]
MRNFNHSKIALSVAVFLAGGTTGYTAEQTGAEEVEKIQITGSRIARSSAQMTTPTTVLDAKAIEMSGVKNIGDLMHKLPAMIDGVGGVTARDQNGSGLSTAGQELVNLRGLGTERSLVLVNGRRHVPGDAGNSAVDLSMIPTALVERVEIITGGASAIYGADAVTGVVNFIMKKDFVGFDIDASYGESAEGDAKSNDLSITFGQDFANGKGNFTVHATYSKKDEVKATSRNYANLNHSFLSNPDNTGPNDGIPDTLFVNDLRFQALSAEGLIYVPNDNYFFGDMPITQAPVPTFANDPIEFPFGKVGYDTFTIDRADGRFRPFENGAFCSGPVTCDGGDGFRTPETIYLVAPSDRFLFDFGTRYDIADDLTIFANAKYAKVESFATGQASIFHDDNFGPLVSLKLDSPFLPEGLRPLMQERALTEVGLAVVGLPSSADNTRETKQFTFGGEGQFSDYDYEFYIQHGQVDGDIYEQTTYNERYYRALDATTNEAGEAVCRDTSDSSCVAYNPIFKQASPEALAYAGVILHRQQKMKQTLASFVVNGDLGSTSLGPIAFAAGLEYRKEQSSNLPDPLTYGRDENGIGLGLVGLTTGQSAETNIFLSPVEGSYDVKELFAEVSVPLLSDLPLIESLDFEVAGRYADNSITGGDFTYKTGFNWQIGYDIGSRVSFSRAVRAPNVQELFAPSSAGANNFTDPCHNTNLTANAAAAANRKANCAALGLSEEFVSNASFGTVLQQTSGNEQLKPETADTLTVGLTYTPSADFNLAIDYWDIEITDAITEIDGTDVLENCVDGAQLDSNFCDKVKRADNGNILYVGVNSINAARFSASGVDVEGMLGFDLALGRLSFRVNASYLDERISEQNPKSGQPIENQAGNREYPRVRANISTTYQYEDLTASINSNYVGSSTFNKTRSDEYYPSEFGNQVASYTTHNLRVNYQASDEIVVYLGINNFANKKPPRLPLLNQGNMYYDAIGRTYRAGVKYSF